MYGERHRHIGGNLFTLIVLLVAVASIFIYDLWHTWWRTTAWRRELRRQRRSGDM